jgi:hypothetical protein
MVLIGLGSAGTGIVNSFSGVHTKICITESDFPSKCKKEEDFEEHCPKFKKQLSFKQDECWFVLCGASKCSSATLRLLETIKKKKINIIYVCPDPDLSGPTLMRRHKVVYNVLQEYTRSGLINKMCIISNREVLKVIGNQSIMDMYQNINSTIANTIETVEWFKSEDPVMGSLHEPKEISRIYTVSIGNFNKNEENLLFLLDNPTETCYIYSISKENLENNKDLIPLIRSRVLADEEKEINSSFAIYSSQHKQSFFYSIKLTHYVQPMEIK